MRHPEVQHVSADGNLWGALLDEHVGVAFYAEGGAVWHAVDVRDVPVDVEVQLLDALGDLHRPRVSACEVHPW